MKKYSKMKKLLILLLLVSFENYAQTSKPNLQDKKLWVLSGRRIENIKDKKGIRFSEEQESGLLLLKDYEFSNGTIEFDVKGKNILQQSFVGIAFHSQNEKTYDAVYFRPFNFRNPDTTKQFRAVQYVSVPDYDWPKLREQFPSKYENSVKPVLDPEDWFHVKVIINDKDVKVFANNYKQPSLVVQKLTNTKTGKIGLWVGNGSGGDFANLIITPKK
jgi:hypothetical protein